MTDPINPQASTLPGIRNLNTVIVSSTNVTGYGDFTDKDGAQRRIEYEFTSVGGRGNLLLWVDDESMCTFVQCLPPYQALWYATGLFVVTTKCGIASNIYALARDLLLQLGAQITPSGNITKSGAKFWGMLDPGIRAKFQPNPNGSGDFVFW